MSDDAKVVGDCIAAAELERAVALEVMRWREVSPGMGVYQDPETLRTHRWGPLEDMAQAWRAAEAVTGGSGALVQLTREEAGRWECCVAVSSGMSWPPPSWTAQGATAAEALCRAVLAAARARRGG